MAEFFLGGNKTPRPRADGNEAYKVLEQRLNETDLRVETLEQNLENVTTSHKDLTSKLEALEKERNDLSQRLEKLEKPAQTDTAETLFNAFKQGEITASEYQNKLKKLKRW